MKRKEAIYKGLDVIDVFYNDSTLTSPNVFQITEFPTRLTSGKNLFKLKGHPTNLKVGSYLNIEILDSNGEPIYHEVLDYLDDDKSRIIAIYVYEDTPPGTAIVTLLGELQEINNQSIPINWQGRSNAKWTRTIEVNPNIVNNTEIIYSSIPAAILTEQIGVQLNRVYPNSEQFPTYTTGQVRYFSYNNTPALELSNGVFTKDMEGGTITIANPINPAPTLQYNVSNATFQAKIDKVLSNTLALLDTTYTVTSTQTLSTHTYTSFDSSAYTLTYEATPTYVPTQNSESFANIQITGLQPDTGDVSRIKILLNGNGTIGTWEQINDIELEETELFTDTANIFPDFKIGSFTTQSVIDTYWESKYYNGNIIGTAPTLTHETVSLANAVKVTPQLGDDISAKNQVHVLQTKNAYAATFVSQSSYKIVIDAIGTRSTVSNNSNPILSVYLSGSAFPFDDTDRLNQELPATVGLRVGQLEVTTNSKRFDDVKFEFDAPASGTASLLFVIESGEWMISDVRTTTDNESGYTPNYTQIRTEVPTKHKAGNQYTFRIDYFNVDGVKSKQSTYVSNVDWQGGNRYIDGEYSMLTGSLYVADSLESGIAISGYQNTGFIRSLGYSGFEYGDPGFLIWSGSALSGSSGTKGGVPYSGVGLELYANANNYFRFSTSDSELDVRTEKFFVGNTSTFISASNGNLEISSSNFVVNDTGLRVITSGSVMLDTSTGYSDGKNISRHIPISTTTQPFVVFLDGETNLIIIGFPNSTAGTLGVKYQKWNGTGFDADIIDSGSFSTGVGLRLVKHVVDLTQFGISNIDITNTAGYLGVVATNMTSDTQTVVVRTIGETGVRGDAAGGITETT